MPNYIYKNFLRIKKFKIYILIVGIVHKKI